MKAPGVYHQEISGASKPIEGIGVSIFAALVHSDLGIPNKPKLITSFEQFVKNFGSYRLDGYSAYSMQGLMQDNPGRMLYANRVVGSGARKAAGCEDTKQAQKTDGSVTAASPTLTSAGSAFITSKVIPGDYVIIPSGANAGAYKVLKVESATQLDVTENFGNTESSITFTVVGSPAAYGHLACYTLSPGAAGDDMKLTIEKEIGDTTLRAILEITESGVTRELERLTNLSPVPSAQRFIDTIVANEAEWFRTDTKPEVQKETGSDGASAGGNGVFTSASASFITVGNKAGDILYITSGTNTGTHVIASVDSQTQVTVTSTLTTASNQAYIALGEDADGSALLALIGANGKEISLAGGVDDVPISIDYIGSQAALTGLYAFDPIDAFLNLFIPDASIVVDGVGADATTALNAAALTYCANRQDVFYIFCTEMGLTPTEALAALETDGHDSKYAALYYPWIWVNDPVSQTKKLVPPVGHIGGVYAVVDNGEEGIHKAPANEKIGGVIGLEYEVSQGEMEVLNPRGINCLVKKNGYRVYGGRTISSDPEWVWIHKRRTFIFFWKSIIQSMDWVVFQVNDKTLWGKVKRTVTAFLRNYDRRSVRNGSLFNGTNPTEAPYFVLCDESLNPPGSSKLTCRYGLYIVETAEIVVFESGLWDGGYEISEV